MMQRINEAERNLASYEHLDPPDIWPVYFCEHCQKTISVGDRRWNINGSFLCDDCAKEKYSLIVED